MKFVAIIGLLWFFLGCSQHSKLKDGALCTINDGEGFYRVAKVLVVDDAGIHVRLYKNKWKERPTSVDPSILSLGSVNDKDGFGIGHMALTKQSFAAWKPVIIGEQEVKKEELDGYEMWKDGGGGYFGTK